MSESIYNMFDFSTDFPECKKIEFFQACDWNKHSFKFKLYKRNRVLSKKDALEDFKVFKYAINNLYCGKPIHEKHNVNFEKCFEFVEKYINTEDKITSKDLCEKYTEALKDRFVDNHFYFLLPMDNENQVRLPTRKNYLPYFTGIVVEKSDDRFQVVFSETKQVKIGDVIEDTGCMFETLSTNGKQRFLVGCRSWKKCESMQILCNGKTISIKTHLCRVGQNENRDIIFSHYKDDEIDIVRTNTFDSSVDKTTPEKASALGTKLKSSRNIVFDMHHNSGGNSLYSVKFFEALNGYCESEPYTSMELLTSLHTKNVVGKEWFLHTKKDIDLGKAKFSGKVIILTDYYCASSAEETINFSKSLRDVVRVGTNTNGCNNFTNLWVCILPKTHMAIFLPNVVFLDMFEEGKGFEPDYWLDTTDPLKEIIKWLKSR